jgi:hypothetical protein
VNHENAENFENLLTNTNDLLETARKVKGEEFACAAGHMFEVLQLIELIAMLAGAAGLPANPDSHYIKQAVLLGTSTATFLSSRLPPDDAVEAMHLAEQMVERHGKFLETIARG